MGSTEILLAAAKELILSTDELGAVWLQPWEADAFERCSKELRQVDGQSWEKIVKQAKKTPYHIERENWHAEHAEWLALQAEHAARETEEREKKWRERQFLEAFLADGERPRAEVYAAIRETFPEYQHGSMSCFASSWSGIAKRKEADVWYWRLKSAGRPAAA